MRIDCCATRELSLWMFCANDHVLRDLARALTIPVEADAKALFLMLLSNFSGHEATALRECHNACVTQAGARPTETKRH
jgi:hypothetical protein